MNIRKHQELQIELEHFNEMELEQELHPIKDDDFQPENEHPNKTMLKRELRAIALKRLEDGARTVSDFEEVIKEWDLLDSNRERKELIYFLLNQEPMYMKDWLETIDDYLKMTRRDILTSSGHISHKQALDKAHPDSTKHKNRLEDTMSPVEQDFIKSIGTLEEIADSGKK